MSISAGQLGSLLNEIAPISNINIPDTITRIDDYAFYECTSLTEINIPNSVVSIGKYAFSKSGLKSITVPSSVDSVDIYVFAECDDLEEAILRNTIKYNTAQLCFANCISLKKCSLSKNTTAIPGAMFVNCSSLTDITISDSVCSSLTGITIPDSVTTIGSVAFWGCTSLENLTIPDSVTTIGTWAFENCTSLKSVNISNSVTNIDYGTFQGCTSLQSVTIGKGVMNIDKYAFYGCSSLANITIPDNVANIGERAFQNCTSLQSVKIGEGVVNISDYVFKGCSKLASITLPETVVQIGQDVFTDTKYYDNSDNWFTKDSVKYLVINNHLIKATTSSKYRNYDLYTYNGENLNITDIASKACTNLVSSSLYTLTIYANSSLEYIGENAFSDNKNITIYAPPDSYTAVWGKQSGFKVVETS